MARPPDFIPYIPSIIPLLPPRDTPTIEEQLKCPAGTHREIGRGCVPDPPPKRVEIPIVFDPDTGGTRECMTDDECQNPQRHRPPPCPPGTTRSGPGGTCAEPFKIPRPPKEARGPLPPPIIVPPPVVPAPAPSPSPVDRTTGRYFPRSTARLPTLVEAASRAGLILWVLGTAIIGPFVGYRERSLFDPLPRSAGPPRRRGRVRVATPEADPGFRVTYPPGTGLPIPLPRRTPDARPRTVTPQPGRGPLPARPRALPRTGTPVSPVLAPAGWLEPIPGPGFDPFTVAPPTPSPAPRPAPAPARPRVGPRVTFPLGLPLPLGVPVRSFPRVAPRDFPSPLTPQQPTRPRTPLRPQQPRLTPFNDPVPVSQPQALRKPTSANPCTAERTARRRRQKKCREFTTKTIRVCAD